MALKIIVIGLGNFGSNLCNALMEDGHEVIGVDKDNSKVDLVQGKISYAIGMDTSEEANFVHLPLDDADIVIIAIGENVGASITSTALVKKNFKGRIIARIINPVHKTILEAMKIEEIVEPEAEFANELANRIMLSGAVKSMDLPGDYEIAEIKIPKLIIGKTLIETDVKNKYNVHIVTVIKQSPVKNIFGQEVFKSKVYGILRSAYVFEENDLLLIFGRKKDIEKFIQYNE